MATAAFMRIMKFDTTTGMVNIETFTPAVSFTGLSWDLTSGRHDGHSHINRAIDLVSDYTPASGAGMDNETASTFSISYLGYTVGVPGTADSDSDFIEDHFDNCPFVANGPAASFCAVRCTMAANALPSINLR